MKSLPSQYLWLIELLAFLTLLIVVNRALKTFFLKLRKRSDLAENDWRLFIEHATLPPFKTLLWILFAIFLIQTSAHYLKIEERVLNITPLRSACLIGCLAWMFLNLKEVFLRVANSRGKHTINQGLLETVGKFSTVIVLFVSLLLILQIFGINIQALIAFGGIGAAIMGFASKDVIANFYGGFMIHTTRPFAVHDLIELPQKKITGHVEHIGWYLTTIRDLHKKSIYIPNAVFSTEYIVNQTRMTHRRIEEKIGLRFQDADKVESLVKKIRNFLQSHPGIDQREPIYVSMINFGVSSIDLEVKAYTVATQYNSYMQVQQAILLRIYTLIKQEGAEMPFPTREVLMLSNPHLPKDFFETSRTDIETTQTDFHKPKGLISKDL